MFPEVTKNLIFDADDTLWENNIYFLEAIEKFLDVMEAVRLNRDEVKRALTETERNSIAQHGYGSIGFTRSLVATARDLVPEISQETIAHVESFGRSVTDRDSIELLDGVEVALDHLALHNRLFLLTKGEDGEQRRKVERSRVAHHFEDVTVVREKDVSAYRELVDRLGLDPTVTWMIGNSPRSDINPALAAGLNAVLIPHADTWELELEEIAEEHHGDRLTVVDSMSELVALFTPRRDG